MTVGEKEKTVIIGVTGGIACYKAVELVRLLVKDSLAVQVIMTRAAMEFVTPLTFQTLSGKPVATETFNLTQESEIGHINLADSADLFVIAPATANVIGKIAAGIADDLLTTVLMATQAPVLIAPAMNIHMYENPILQENIRKLRRIGYHFMEPAEGYLACGYEGKGRLPEPEKILEEIRSLLRKKDLLGERFLITAGPSREPLDPVRYISNRSSGKMGYALARAAVRRGAGVVLVSGPSAIEPPSAVRLIPVNTAAEMRRAVLEQFPECTAVIMAAAVADYRPVDASSKKLKRGKAPLDIRLEPNPDILRELGRRKNGKLLVGFAAETEELIANATRKLHEKNLDLIVANDVTQAGGGFDGDTNIATIVDRSGASDSLSLMTKDELADRIYDHLLALKDKHSDGNS
ncbi:MAG: bifunctional phosphopantothenoylcysteine decarboxylase/phosphopantothenate--cysteine ligase CoaBC [Deltaproteobacteria bacterium]|nr:MAG: bifunctional phosphopantothenoylcysteine decarboxylase/phosphopantothenate--cysteine ligase CoaBC [Deltaproteobacteria bacterium]